MEKYFQAKKIVDKKFSQDNPFYMFYVIALYGILMKYGEYSDAVDDIFQKTNIYIERKPISQILRDHEIEGWEPYDEQENNKGCPTFTFGLSFRGDHYEFDEEGNLYPKPIKPFLACSLNYLNPTSLLHAFIHEFGHLLKSYYNGCSIISKKDEVGYSIRSGLTIESQMFDKKDKTVHYLSLLNTLDEVINVLQTTEMVEATLPLRDIINDPKIQQYFSFVRPELMGEDFGYNTCTDALRPLWKNDIFKNLVEAHLMDGNIQAIIQKYDEIMGEDSFYQLDELLEKLDRMENQGIKGEPLEQLQSQIQAIVLKFNQKTQKMFEK